MFDGPEAKEEIEGMFDVPEAREEIEGMFSGPEAREEDADEVLPKAAFIRQQD